jgi:hypothetical protein
LFLPCSWHGARASTVKPCRDIETKKERHHTSMNDKSQTCTSTRIVRRSY